MTGLVIAEAVAIALLGLLVAGLLRSHAEILRALHQLGVGVEHASGPANVISELDFPGVREGVAPPRSAEAADRVHDIAGLTPWDESVAVGVAADDRSTLIAFLSTGCSTCSGFWDELTRPGGARLPSATRLVIVTKGDEEESISAVRSVAPSGTLVVMSSAAWADYEVPGSPYFLLVEGGRVAGEGSGTTWHQIRALLGQAADDTEVNMGRSDRVDRVDRDLSAAGIHPGHPSLYPDAE